MPAQEIEHRQTRPVEVIIVLLILLIVGALCLPALQTVSDKNQGLMMCANNLRQLGLSCQNYATARKGRLPTGTIIESAREPEQRLSVFVTLLPYVENEHLFKSLDWNQGWQAPANKQAVSTHVPTYLCWVNQMGQGATNITHYVGVAGVGSDAARLPATDARAGVFGYDRRINMADVANNPILFIETTNNNGPWAAGGPTTIRGIEPDAATPIRENGPVGSRHGRKPSANVVFMDGSWRTLDGKISAVVLTALATIR